MGKSNARKKTKKQQQQIEVEKTKKMQWLVVWTLAVILAVCVVALIVKAASGPQAESTVDAKEFQYEKQQTLGSKDAPVKIAEFVDFKCPACKKFSETILPQIKRDFVDSGEAQLCLINYPIISPDADSRTAAMAGEAVYSQNPAEFWKFYEAVYAHQGDERTEWATSDFLVQIARQAALKIDYNKLKKDIDNGTFAQNVKDDEAIVKRLGVDSTPTIYINGKAVSVDDTFNYSAIKEAILKAKGEFGT
jgi:protein-disulfide isomerase